MRRSEEEVLVLSKGKRWMKMYLRPGAGLGLPGGCFCPLQVRSTELKEGR